MGKTPGLKRNLYIRQFRAVTFRYVEGQHVKLRIRFHLVEMITQANRYLRIGPLSLRHFRRHPLLAGPTQDTLSPADGAILSLERFESQIGVAAPSPRFRGMQTGLFSSTSDSKSLGTQDTSHTTVLQHSRSGTTDQNDDQGIPSEQEKAAAKSDVVYVEWEKDDPENPFNWPIRKVRKSRMIIAKEALNQRRSILSLLSLS